MNPAFLRRLPQQPERIDLSVYFWGRDLACWDMPRHFRSGCSRSWRAQGCVSI